MEWSEVIAGIIGGLIAIIGQLIVHEFKQRKENRLSDQRQILLKKLLNPSLNGGHQWMSLETLSKVIGADAEETKRLLILAGARGSRTKKDVWALIEDKPLFEAAVEGESP